MLMTRTIALAERQDALAELISQDTMSVAAAGRSLGLTKGETARAWSEIKRNLGAQAC